MTLSSDPDPPIRSEKSDFTLSSSQISVIPSDITRVADPVFKQAQIRIHLFRVRFLNLSSDPDQKSRIMPSPIPSDITRVEDPGPVLNKLRSGNDFSEKKKKLGSGGSMSLWIRI